MAHRDVTGAEPGGAGRRYPVELSEQEWRSRLSPQESQVLRQAGTEMAFASESSTPPPRASTPAEAVGPSLLDSDTKFASHCGWPSCYAPRTSDAVEPVEDRSAGMVRTEARCARCGSHLGHVFSGEGYATPTDERWCINSVSLRLESGSGERRRSQEMPST